MALHKVHSQKVAKRAIYCARVIQHYEPSAPRTASSQKESGSDHENDAPHNHRDWSFLSWD